MNTFASQYGYLGIFSISLIGSMSLFIPIPYPIAIFALGANLGFDPLWIAVAAGLGSAIGEFSGYLIGVGGRKAIGQKYKTKMDFLMKLFKKFGPVAIFLFALTPLPDDLLFIPLGVMGYSVLRAFIPALIGKFFSNLIIAYSGRWSSEFISTLFGLEGEGSSLLVGTIIGILLMILVIIIMFKVDWEKRFSNYIDTPEEKVQKNEQKI